MRVKIINCLNDEKYLKIRMCRIDKYLWSIRVYKTRSDAAEACRSGKVKVNGMEAKASKDIKSGDTIAVRRNIITYTLRVIETVDRRQPAKLVSNYVENLTPQEELDKLNTPKESVFLYRERGMGRPTKKERRDMEELFDSFDDD